uniref:ANK_REP_REGION domain-containing protein n=1 Tax=Strongyloides papillosus TaxID=174720 RepID=A0A0N5BND5_STREA
MPPQSSKQKSQSKQKKLRNVIISIINEHYPISSSQLRYRINAANKNFSGYPEEYMTNFIKCHLEDEISILKDKCENFPTKCNDKNIILYCPKNMPANANSTDRLVRSRSSLSRRQQQKMSFEGSESDAFAKVLSTLKTKNGEPVSWSKIRTQYNKMTGRSLTLDEFNKIANTDGLTRKTIIETKLCGLLSPYDKKCDNVIINEVFGCGDTGCNKENSTPNGDVHTNLGKGDEELKAFKQQLDYVKNNHDSIMEELAFYEAEVESRGNNHVLLLDLALQYSKDTGNKALIFDSLINNTEGSRDVIITMLASKFKLDLSNINNIYLSSKDLDFHMEPNEDSAAIDKPCTLEHEKEVENNLEAIAAGGDILIDDYNDDNKDTGNNKSVTGCDELSFTDHLNAIGTEDPGDALEVFICSRLQNLCEEGMESIPINDLDNLINEFFEMKVDPIREFGCSWEKVAENFVERNFFYYTLDKKGLVLKDPTTPEVYEDHVKIPSDYSCSSQSDSDSITLSENSEKQFIDVSPASDYDSVCDTDILNDESEGFEKAIVPPDVENVRKEKFEKISSEMVNIFDNDTNVESLPSIDIENDSVVNDKTADASDISESDKIIERRDVDDVNKPIENEEKPLLTTEEETLSKTLNQSDENNEKALGDSSDKSNQEAPLIDDDKDSKKKSKGKSGKFCCCTIC